MSRSGRAKLRLYDVDDVEGLVYSVIERTLRQWGGAFLSDERKQDLAQYLLQKAWQISGLDAAGSQRTAWVVEVAIPDGAGGWTMKRVAVVDREAVAIDVRLAVWESTPPPGCFDPRLSRSLSTYLGRVLPMRMIDWLRQDEHDARYGDRPKPLSLERISDSTGVSIADVVGPDPHLEQEEVLDRVARGL